MTDFANVTDEGMKAMATSRLHRMIRLIELNAPASIQDAEALLVDNALKEHIRREYKREKTMKRGIPLSDIIGKF